jgi:hypothetical protein
MGKYADSSYFDQLRLMEHDLASNETLIVEGQ